MLTLDSMFPMSLTLVSNTFGYESFSSVNLSINECMDQSTNLSTNQTIN